MSVSWSVLNVNKAIHIFCTEILQVSRHSARLCTKNSSASPIFFSGTAMVQTSLQKRVVIVRNVQCMKMTLVIYWPTLMAFKAFGNRIYGVLVIHDAGTGLGFASVWTYKYVNWFANPQPLKWASLHNHVNLFVYSKHKHTGGYSIDCDNEGKSRLIILFYVNTV